MCRRDSSCFLFCRRVCRFRRVVRGVVLGTKRSAMIDTIKKQKALYFGCSCARYLSVVFKDMPSQQCATK